MLAVSESLKRRHKQEDVFILAESAKKAEFGFDPQSESDTNATNDVRLLLESSNAESETAKDCHDEVDLLLTEIEQTLNQEERTDDPVSKKLTDIVNQRWLQRLMMSSIKKSSTIITDQQTARSFWSIKLTAKFDLNRFARFNDLKLSRVQEQVTKVGHILVTDTEHLLKAKSGSNLCLADLVKMKIEAIALIGNAAHEITRTEAAGKNES